MTQRLLISFLLLAVLGQGLSAQKLGGRLKKLLGKDKTEQTLDTAALPASYVLADGLMARALTVDLAGQEPDGIFVQSLVFVTQMDEKARLEAMDVQGRQWRAVMAVGLNDDDEKAPYYTCRLRLTQEGTRLNLLADSISLVSPGFLGEMKGTAFERMNPEKEKTRQQWADFAARQDQWLGELQQYIVRTPAQPVTHWDDIRARRVVKGMNETEALLAGGVADFVRKSGERTRWMMPNQSTIIFEQGRVVSVVR